MKKAYSPLLAAVLFLAVFADTQTWVADKAHTYLGFSLVHLAISELEGKFNNFDAKFTATKDDFSDAVFELTADVKSVTTFNATRDGNLQKPNMFDTEKFPTLTFKSTSISKTGNKTFDLTGDLTMKGTTKSVTLQLTLLGTQVNPRDQKQVVGWKATGTINRTDFGVGSDIPPSMVSDEIILLASGEFVKE